MQVNFKGFKNVGYHQVNSASLPFSLDGSNIESSLLNVQYTDDYNGKDLTEYRSLIKKHPQYRNHVNPDFMNVILYKDDKSNRLPKMLFNGRTLAFNDENLDIFSFVARSSKKISEQSKDKFVINNDYLESDDFFEGFVPFGSLKIDFLMSNEVIKRIRELHNPEKVKEGAKDLLDKITSAVIDYLND